MSIAIQERATRAVMASVAAANGHTAGLRYAGRWELFPTGRSEARDMPTMEKAASMFPMDQPVFDWSEVERLADLMKAGT